MELFSGQLWFWGEERKLGCLRGLGPRLLQHVSPGDTVPWAEQGISWLMLALKTWARHECVEWLNDLSLVGFSKCWHFLSLNKARYPYLSLQKGDTTLPDWGWQCVTSSWRGWPMAIWRFSQILSYEKLRWKGFAQWFQLHVEFPWRCLSKETKKPDLGGVSLDRERRNGHYQRCPSQPIELRDSIILRCRGWMSLSAKENLKYRKFVKDS